MFFSLKPVIKVFHLDVLRRLDYELLWDVLQLVNLAIREEFSTLQLKRVVSTPHQIDILVDRQLFELEDLPIILTPLIAMPTVNSVPIGQLQSLNGRMVIIGTLEKNMGNREAHIEEVE